jgi:DNA-binding FrmR family transcriptional regulator
MVDHPTPGNLERVIPELTRRLRRIAGQAQGIERMLTAGRDCGEVVNQVAALKAAVEQVGVTLVSCLLEGAIRQAVEQGEESNDAVEQAKRLLGRI